MHLIRGVLNMIKNIVATKHSNAQNEIPNSAQDKLMLTVDKLTIITATGIQLVDALSYELRQGQTLAIVGESGSGKSIASLALLGLLPDSLTITGVVQLANTVGMSTLPIANDKARNAALQSIRGQRIGMVFQEPMTALNPLHTVAKQIAESLRLSGVPKKQWRDTSIALLDDVNIADPSNKLSRYC
ncbi:ATP-binding cassette domain-containing protein [Psychrobacter sp. NPDC078370]|uniref:ATP-binding cassette domain-containing protein n=1 Tax=Psychrobacter sp. NPDC078370 TaxID=3390659 RepID=UPI003D046EE1